MNNSMYVLKRLLPGALLTMQLLNNTHAAPPVVNLIGPTNGAAFATGAPILLTANATDADGTVSYVEFFAGLLNLGRVDGPTTNGLYERAWFGAPSGMFQLRAEAVDDQGARSVSASVPIAVSGLDGVTPTLDPIANLSILEDAGSQTVALSGIGLGDTNASAPLTIIAVSSNPNLVLNPAINYTSPNATGSLIFTPVANSFGQVVITVLVNNGQPSNNIVARSFIVTVAPVNDSPEISAISDRTINKNTAALIAFTVRDVETPASSLIMSGSSSNPTLVPAANLAFGGSGANRVLTVIPAPDQSGTTTITMVAQDADGGAASRSFSLTVVPVNDLPVISAISDRTINKNTSTGPIAFTVQDVETPAFSLIVSGSSDNPTLVPSTNLVFGGSGTNRVLTVLPAPDQSGTAIITIAVRDSAGGTASNAFSLTIEALPTIRVISVSPETGVDLIVYGLAGRTHIVECSEDTVTWTPISSGTMPQAAFMPVRDASATTVTSRFYRVIELP